MSKKQNKNNKDNSIKINLNDSSIGKLIPHKCPVCNGRGCVPSGFYTYNNYHSTTALLTEMCRTCNGKGIVWS